MSFPYELTHYYVYDEHNDALTIYLTDQEYPDPIVEEIEEGSEIYLLREDRNGYAGNIVGILISNYLNYYHP